MQNINSFYNTLKASSNGLIQVLCDLNIKIEDDGEDIYTNILKKEVAKIFAPDSVTFSRLNAVIRKNSILLNLLKLYKNLIKDGYGERNATTRITLKVLILAKDMDIFTYKTALKDYNAIKKIELDEEKN